MENSYITSVADTFLQFINIL